VDLESIFAQPMPPYQPHGIVTRCMPEGRLFDDFDKLKKHWELPVVKPTFR
jgi:hypothetical protein